MDYPLNGKADDLGNSGEEGMKISKFNNNYSHGEPPNNEILGTISVVLYTRGCPLIVVLSDVLLECCIQKC